QTAARWIWFLFQVITAVIVVAAVLIALSRAGTWQSELDRYLAGGQKLLKQTAGWLENTVPLFERMNLATQVDEGVKEFTGHLAKKNLLPLTALLLKWTSSLVLIPYLTYFMMTDSGRLKKYLVRSVPNAFFEKALLLFSRLDASLQNYFQGLLLLTLLDAA